jgi:mannose-6-phosphate isomerase
VLQERIWGVEVLPDWYAQPSEGKPIGEAWLTAESCVVSGGTFDGMTLSGVTRRFPKALGGGDAAEFPLLIKTLFPREKLSVQVHPNDVDAQEIGEPRGKTECWYVLSAEPGAQLALGFREEISHDQIRAAIADATLEDKLKYVPVKTGDMVYVDAGTVHAIGPGMVVLETQQYSDVTYRLYDYGRPRPLHVDAGLAVTRMHTDAGVVTPLDMGEFTRLVQSQYFAVDRFKVEDSAEVSLGSEDRLQMLFPTQPGCELLGEFGRLMLEPGRIVVLPAEGVAYTLRAKRTAQVIRILQP